MFKRPALRFSLLTLLLFVALVTVSGSHWWTSRKLSIAEKDLKFASDHARKNQQTIRELNDKLGWLTVDDKEKVHVISETIMIPRQRRKYSVSWQSSFSWRVYLPPNSNWRVCWTGGKVPSIGVPSSKSGEHLLRNPGQSDSCINLHVEHLPPTESSVALEFRSGNDIWSGVISGDRLTEFRWNDRIRTESTGGNDRRSARTESFSPSGPVVLLRQWRVTDSHDAATPPGLAIWLEPVAKKSAVPTGE